MTLPRVLTNVPANDVRKSRMPGRVLAVTGPAGVTDAAGGTVTETIASAYRTGR